MARTGHADMDRRLSEPAPALRDRPAKHSDSRNDDGIPDLIATTESSAPVADQLGSHGPVRFNPHLVQESFAALAAIGPETLEFMYARLFAASPDTRALFPMAMSAQRERLFARLADLVANLDSEAASTALLERLGREHRKFGVTDRHYAAFFGALRDTVRHFTGGHWTPEVAAAWDGALRHMSDAMRGGSAADAATSPPWWVAEVVEHELRSPGVAVLKLAPGQPLPYRAGQYVPVQVTRWPRVWRPFSVANAPRPGGMISLHVRAVPGGLVSNSLVYHTAVGDTVMLGAASGTMTLAESERDLLCVAGGTGLAPIKAVIEHAIAAATRGNRRKITLFVGARQHFDLYDLQDLQLLESAYPPLRVITVLSDEPGYSGLLGPLPEVVHERFSPVFEHAEAYICGPAPMVSMTAALLAARIPAQQIHHDPLI
jgi:NAD(P)H-flavin reductase/hemoglobin-like flavoprotein